MKNYLILGGMGGIGRALIENLLNEDRPNRIYATWRTRVPDFKHERLVWVQVDICSESDIEALSSKVEELDCLINCIGILHLAPNQPEKSVKRLETDFFQDNLRINTLPSLLLAKYFANKLKKTTPAIFATISAKVGSIDDNKLGGWYSYRMSKAALNMGLKCLSIEWQRSLKNVCVAAIHPGTTDTQLSKPYQRNISKVQLFPADRTAKQILTLINKLTPADTGQFWSWDGSTLPW